MASENIRVYGSAESTLYLKHLFGKAISDCSCCKLNSLPVPVARVEIKTIDFSAADADPT